METKKWSAIRPARPGDAAAIAAIYAPYVEKTAISYECIPPDAAEMSRRMAELMPQMPWLVWEEDGEILGYAYASPAFQRRAYAFLADLSIYLREDVRGRGIGTAFYAVLEEILYRQGYCRVYALVTAANAASCRFHEALGYRVFTVFEQSGLKLGDWHSTVWFEKVLRPQEGLLPFPVSWRDLNLSDLF